MSVRMDHAPTQVPTGTELGHKMPSETASKLLVGFLGSAKVVGSVTQEDGPRNEKI